MSFVDRSGQKFDSSCQPGPGRALAGLGRAGPGQARAGPGQNFDRSGQKFDRFLLWDFDRFDQNLWFFTLVCPCWFCRCHLLFPHLKNASGPMKNRWSTNLRGEEIPPIFRRGVDCRPEKKFLNWQYLNPEIYQVIASRLTAWAGEGCQKM